MFLLSCLCQAASFQAQLMRLGVPPAWASLLQSSVDAGGVAPLDNVWRVSTEGPNAKLAAKI
jgi:hypothetical protein